MTGPEYRVDTTAGSLCDRLRRHLRLEDALLFGWLVLVAPLLPIFGATAGANNGPQPLLGLLDLVALVGLAAGLGARSAPGVVPGLVSGGDFRYALGPLVGALFLAIDDTVANLDPGGSVGPFLVLALIGIGLVARFRLPPLAAAQRRALVTPFILATSGYFGQFLSGIARIFDLRPILGDLTSDPRAVAFALAIGTLGVLVFYLMLVFAPRQVAER
ncbi:MAG: hypothetical protein ACHQ15_08110, partial [Candidatus Limnocylindrales bacterium]